MTSFHCTRAFSTWSPYRPKRRHTSRIELLGLPVRGAWQLRGKTQDGTCSVRAGDCLARRECHGDELIVRFLYEKVGPCVVPSRDRGGCWSHLHARVSVSMLSRTTDRLVPCRPRQSRAGHLTRDPSDRKIARRRRAERSLWIVFFVIRSNCMLTRACDVFFVFCCR